jgi:hypothetical protein
MLLNTIKHLLPRAKAWVLTRQDKLLTQFFTGLSVALGDIRDYIDFVVFQLNPGTTDQLEEWEKQFGLIPANLTEQQRRTRLENRWSDAGGLGLYTIQNALQAAGFDVYVHNYWEPIDNGFLISGDPEPVIRVPFDYLNDGTDGVFTVDGSDLMTDGGEASQDGGTDTPIGYPLVNNILAAGVLGDGDSDMYDGGETAQDGTILNVFVKKSYPMPTDPDTFRYYFYISGQTFPEPAVIPAGRMTEFETLCLKLKPAHMWAGIIISYS